MSGDSIPADRAGSLIFFLKTDLKPVVCVFYRSLQQHVGVQLDLQVNAGFSPRLQVTEMTHQLLTRRITATAKLHRNTVPVTETSVLIITS